MTFQWFAVGVIGYFLRLDSSVKKIKDCHAPLFPLCRAEAQPEEVIILRGKHLNTKGGATVDSWNWSITDELYAERRVLRTPSLDKAATLDPCLLWPCPEDPFPYAFSGAPTGYKRKARASKKISPLLFSLPWQKESYCRTAMPFLIPPAALPVSLDCEYARVELYDGSAPDRDGGGVIWRGTNISVPVSVAVVDVCGRVLYDAYIQPHYTPSLWTDCIHGITQRTLRESGKTVFFHDARAHLVQILADRPVYGVGVAGDLRVLELDEMACIEPVELAEVLGVQNLVVAADKAGSGASKGGFSLEAIYQAATGTPLRTGKYHSALEDACAAMTILRIAEPSWQKICDDCQPETWLVRGCSPFSVTA